MARPRARRPNAPGLLTGQTPANSSAAAARTPAANAARIAGSYADPTDEQRNSQEGAKAGRTHLPSVLLRSRLPVVPALHSWPLSGARVRGTPRGGRGRHGPGR